MGKKGKKAQAGKPKKLTPKDISKRLNALAKTLEEELEGADLFAPLPPTEDCAICLVPLSRSKPSETLYKACCGNAICVACNKEHEVAIKKQNDAGKKFVFSCPFCREPKPTCLDEQFSRLQARCVKNDRVAFTQMGAVYRDGGLGKAKDDLKALDCYIRAVELGSAEACVGIGNSYKGVAHERGIGVAVDKERAALFERVGALRGHIEARYNIGYSEYDLGNHEIAIRHWKIAAEAGYQNSLDALRKIYNADGKVPGKEFMSTEELDMIYRSGHEAQMDVKTEEREKHSRRSPTEG